MWWNNKVPPKSIKVHWIVDNFSSLSFHSSSEPVNDALRLDASRAGVWRLPDRAALPWKWCHHDWDGKLRPHRWQDLWCRPLPDGECAVLPARCLQDNVTEVTIDLFGSHMCVCTESELRWLSKQDIISQHSSSRISCFPSWGVDILCEILKSASVLCEEHHCILTRRECVWWRKCVCAYVSESVYACAWVLECCRSICRASYSCSLCLRSASASSELRSMEALSQLSITHVMEAQGASLGRE